jgi:hypothetical protein
VKFQTSSPSFQRKLKSERHSQSVLEFWTTSLTRSRQWQKFLASEMMLTTPGSRYTGLVANPPIKKIVSFGIFYSAAR